MITDQPIGNKGEAERRDGPKKRIRRRGPEPGDEAGALALQDRPANAHDADRYVKLLDEKHVFESDTLPQPLTGREAGREFMKMYVNAFPDLHFDITAMFGSGDVVVTRWTATGTHLGELMGIPPTNKRTTTHGCTVGQLQDDAIFYLRSRGIGMVEARALLTYAFASDILSRIKVSPLRECLEEALFEIEAPMLEKAGIV